MGALTRREYLRQLLFLIGAAPLAGCRGREPYAERCVCIHVFEPGDALPAPLLTPPGSAAELTPAPRDFRIDLPELMVCTTALRLLDVHRYFGPFTRAHRRQLERAVEIHFEEPEVRTAVEVERLEAFLRDRPIARGPGRTTVVFTLHGGNRRLLPRITHAVRVANVDQFVVLKDPTTPPWFCEFPSRQLNRPW